MAGEHVVDKLQHAGIGTARLYLRAASSADSPALERTWRDPQVRRYLGVGGSEARAEHDDEPPSWFGVVAVTVRATGQLVGFCRLGYHHSGDLELSYTFLPEHWGRGYAREAAAAIVAWCFDTMAAPRVVAVTQSANRRSRRLLEALSLRPVAEFSEFGAQQVMYEATPGVGITFETQTVLVRNGQPAFGFCVNRQLAADLAQRHRRVDAVFVSGWAPDVQAAHTAFAGQGVPIYQDTRLGGYDHTGLAAHPHRNQYHCRHLLERTGDFFRELAASWMGRRIIVLSHPVNKWAFDCLLHGNRISELAASPFHWQPGWLYTLPGAWAVGRPRSQ